jgi:hydrogenase maturation protein HypF
MLEHGWLDREVLGVCWDGTGYGTDGTIWGGEFLVATTNGFRRFAHLRPFALAGGETAVRQPWRVAVALVYQAIGPEAAARLRWSDVDPLQIEQLIRLLAHPHLVPQTTSVGRLFDGVASLVLGTADSQFEGQPAMLLESACDQPATREYAMPLSIGDPATLDWRSLITGVVDDVARGTGAGVIAMKFHRTLASGILSIADRFHQLPVILTGGCFNNRMLTELVAERFDGRFQELGLPGIIPVNDGGLAAGQLAVAIARLKNADLARMENQRCA